MILSKMSDPGWDKEFETEDETRRELYKHICFQCQCEEGITENSSIGDMLYTPCGLEFTVER